MRLVLTCPAMPEQYDVFEGEEQVGYLRLRHGTFGVWRDVHDWETVYIAHPKGDGVFEADERDHYLTEAVKALGGTGEYTIDPSDEAWWTRP